MYFEDLSLYSYAYPHSPLPNVLNVGWLDDTHYFPTGPVATELIRRLAELAMHRPSNPSREYHRCPICREHPARIRVGIRMHPLGSAEIWIPRGPEAYFASPDLLPHYILAHHYQPPEAYLTALTSLDMKRWKPPARL